MKSKPYALIGSLRASILFCGCLCLGVILNNANAQSSGTNVQWKSQTVAKLFYGEGGTLADFDGDGNMDIQAGYMAFFGPDFKSSVEIHPAKPFNINGYSQYFFGFDYDVDKDGHVDLLMVGFPGEAGHWYRNPGPEKCRKESWERFVVLDVVDNESPMFTDVTGDGKPELICCHGGQFGYAEIPSDPKQKWTFHPVSEQGGYQRFTHGIGVGDVNDDGRIDVLAKQGWWEHPEASDAALWKFHGFEFSGPGGAQMYAVDLDGDKRTEVVTSLAAHGYGLVVYKKSNPSDAEAWTRIDVMTDRVETSPTGLAISQLHAIDIGDMDGDGKPDIVTGKRFWAHNGNDNGENEPPYLVWLKPVVVAGGLKFIPTIIDDNSGVGTQVLIRDANKDGRMDVLSVSKRGVHLLTQSDAAQEKSTPHPRDVEGMVAELSVPINDAIGGFRPAWSDKEPMNFDFETGDLTDWQAAGGAFFNQPIQGDTVFARRKDSRSKHQGDYWIGSFEVGQDVAMGSLVSRPFKLTHPWISFLLAGGSGPDSRCELVDAKSGEVLRTVRGADMETLKRAVIDGSAWKGKAIFIRLIDNGREGWGHINFDDFRLHDESPKLAPADMLAAVDVLQHDSLPADKAAQAMTVPDGFKVQVIASEPEVRQPVAMTVDHRNRIWVVEAYTYPVRAEGDNGKDRILIFEDTDLDGKLDSQKIFAENLNLVSGIEVGYGGVWVGAAPYLLFIPDADGDDVPDSAPVRKLDGWGYQDTHETLNSFIWGPDGWLYGCHGVFTHSKVGLVSADGKSGPDEKRVPFNAGIWRYHPVHHRFEVFAHGTSNPWGVDFDDHGQAFLTACVIPHLYHIIPNARYQRQAGPHFNRFTYADIQTIAVHRHWVGDTPHAGNNRSDSAGGGHAHSGAMIYLGGSWPERYRDQIFMNNIHGARLNQDQLARKGSGYFGDRAPDFLLANDRSSQILYFRYVADGQVVAIDWYDAQQCHLTDPAKHDQSNGRIYRISYGDAKPVRVDLSKKTDLELAQYQTDKNDWYCRTARRLLSERAFTKKISPDAVKHLESLTKAAEARIRLRGLWTLSACGLVNQGLLDTLLADRDDRVRSWAIRLSAPTSVAGFAVPTKTPTQVSAKTLAAWKGLAKTDGSPVVRLALASACQELASAQATPIIEELVQHVEDSNDHNLPLMVWYAASKAMQENPAVEPSLLSKAKIESVARFIVRQSTETAMESDDAVASTRMASLLSEIRKSTNAASLLDQVLTGLEKKRTVAMPKGWAALRSAWIADAKTDESIRSRILLLAAKFNDDEAFKALASTAADKSKQLEERVSAIRVLRQVKFAGLGDLAKQLLDEPVIRSAAVAAYADQLDLKSAEELLTQALKWPTSEERRTAWYALVRRPDSAKLLLAAIGDKRVASIELSADMVQQIQQLDAPELIETVKQVWGNVRTASADRVKDAERIKKLVSNAEPAIDLDNGKKLFTKTCGQCHTLFGEGGKIGPELTGSNRRDINYLLENILDPSAVMAREYQPMIILTTEGQTITGLIRSEDKDSIKIQTATEELTVYREDIEKMKQSEVSMMPNDLLSPLSEKDARDLIAYLRSR